MTADYCRYQRSCEMLQLKNIKKRYEAGEFSVDALKGITLSFRTSEFVSILGPSGCGKTTMLNIIGGLDKYTSGDLIINGKSTEKFTDRDWDAYRNHSVGFVFQSYNLIPHRDGVAKRGIGVGIVGCEACRTCAPCQRGVGQRGA